jgi:hypothetical protein
MCATLREGEGKKLPVKNHTEYLDDLARDLADNLPHCDLRNWRLLDDGEKRTYARGVLTVHTGRKNFDAAIDGLAKKGGTCNDPTRICAILEAMKHAPKYLIKVHETTQQGELEGANA